MSGALAVRDAMLATLRADAALAALVNQVSEGDPHKASPPWLMLADGVAGGWGARGVAGLTLRQPVQLTLRGDDAAPVNAILAQVDAALAGMDAPPDGWRITSLQAERVRVARGRTGWRVTIDYVVRAARLA